MKLILMIVTIFISGLAAIPIVVGNLAVIDKNVEITEGVTGENLIEDSKKIVNNIKEKLTKDKSSSDNTTVSTADRFKMLKDVGEAYMDNFGLTDTDFKIISEAGIDVIESNFDICADDEDVKYFLDQSNKYDLKVVMPAGSGEAEWGYECGRENFPSTQRPEWNRERVVTWINKWKDHPAVYAWDTSNEAGSVFPNPSKENMLTEEQLKQAYRDVKVTDPNHPVLIRMNGWFFYDHDINFFREGNPFAKNVADIVMVNAYSNVDEYFNDFVTTVTERSISNIHLLDPDTSIIISLGVWKEPPIWEMPREENLEREISQLRQYEEVDGIAYFKYGAKGSEWYLPDPVTGAPNLLEIISKG